MNDIDSQAMHKLLALWELPVVYGEYRTIGNVQDGAHLFWNLGRIYEDLLDYEGARGVAFKFVACFRPDLVWRRTPPSFLPPPRLYVSMARDFAWLAPREFGLVMSQQFTSWHNDSQRLISCLAALDDTDISSFSGIVASRAHSNFFTMHVHNFRHGVLVDEFGDITILRPDNATLSHYNELLLRASNDTVRQMYNI